MTATRTIGMVLLVVSVLLMGCTTTVKLRLYNETKDNLPISVTGGGVAKSLGILAHYDVDAWREVTFKNKNLPADVALKIGKDQTVFNVAKDGPKKFRFRVATGGKIAPLGEGPLTVEHKTNLRKQIGPSEAVIE